MRAIRTQGAVFLAFSLKFFFLSFGLSLAAGIIQLVFPWVLTFYRLTPSSIRLLTVILVPIGLVVGVIVQFVVMHVESMRVHSLLMFRPILVSTFVGCWSGQVAIFFMDMVVRLLLGMSPIYDGAFWIVWQPVAAAFSHVSFASVSAVLLAYYRKTVAQLPDARIY